MRILAQTSSATLGNGGSPAGRARHPVRPRVPRPSANAGAVFAGASWPLPSGERMDECPRETRRQPSAAASCGVRGTTHVPARLPQEDNPGVDGREHASMSRGAEVRLATAADLDAVAELAISRAAGEHEQWVKRLTEDLVDHERGLWVADRGGEVIGYGRVHRFKPAPDAPPLTAPAGFYLSGLGVSESNRRQGLGRAITRARLEWIAARATEAWFFTNARNEISLRLHAQLGFREVTRAFVFPGVEFEGGTGVLCVVEF